MNFIKFILNRVLVSMVVFSFFTMDRFVLAIGGEDPIDRPLTGFKIKIVNPLNVTTLDQLLDLILQVIVNLGIPIITIAIMYSGFLFIQAQGNPGKVTEAKKNIQYVLIGTAIVFGVGSIIAIIRSTIGGLGS